MKKIQSNEMQTIQGGSQKTWCFALGFATVALVLNPLLLLAATPGIRYCWNN